MEVEKVSKTRVLNLISEGLWAEKFYVVYK